MKQLILSLVVLLAATAVVPLAQAGDVEIVMVKMTHQGETWSAHVTLRHDDTGWDHYADAWRVVGENGAQFGTRTLYHPHSSEQPFTRSLSGITIPADVSVVYVEAHDKVHGWSPQRVRVDLRQTQGERFRVVK
jgi:hypothetical protein